MGAPLPSRVRRGYGLGSVATGSFGTVPGLLLLPYLTDRLGIAAGLAGLIVLLPKAWDVLLNPVAGRISDRIGDGSGALVVPDRMASVNALLDALPPSLREVLLAGVLDRLTR